MVRDAQLQIDGSSQTSLVSMCIFQMLELLRPAGFMNDTQWLEPQLHWLCATRANKATVHTVAVRQEAWSSGGRPTAGPGALGLGSPTKAHGARQHKNATATRDNGSSTTRWMHNDVRATDGGK